MSKTIQPGVMAILTNDKGVVVAHAATFDGNRPGGFKLLEAQKHYARERLANEFIRKWTTEDIAEVMRGYDAEQIIENLCRRKGYRVELLPIGHDEAQP